TSDTRPPALELPIRGSAGAHCPFGDGGHAQVPEARLAVMARRSCSSVPDDARIPEALDGSRAALERTQAVADQLIGLNLHDANQLAARSGRQLRVVKRDGKGLTVTADLGTNRISIESEGDIVVAASSG